MSQINVNRIKNRLGDSGPILSGLSTVSGSLEVSSDATVSGNATFSGSVGVVGIATANGLDVVGTVTCTTLASSTNVSASSSITVGNSFLLSSGAVGLGTTDTTGRDAGVGTAKGTLVYNATTKGVEVYDGNAWVTGLQSFSATGGTKDTTSRSGYAVHTFTGSGNFVTQGGEVTVEVLVVGGGGGGGTGSTGNGAQPSGGAGGGGSFKRWRRTQAPRSTGLLTTPSLPMA